VTPAAPRDPERRVVVTGMGVMTPIGERLDDYFDALVAGRSAVTRWKAMEERCASRIGGDMSGFDLDAHLRRAGDAYPAALAQAARKLMRPTPPSGRIAAPAAMQAFLDAGLPHPSVVPERFGHVLAGHNLNSNYIYEGHKAYLEEPDYIDPLYGVLSEDTDVLSVISELLTLRGPAFTVGGACASGNLGVMAGLDLLRSGRVDAVLVTGASDDLDPTVLHSWVIIDALSVRSFNDEPARASRPFDALREGFVPSHGAAAVVLETLAGARARGARMRAELLGAAATSDATRLTKPDLGGQVRAMRGALEDARTTPGDVDYVNAHATSTPLGDAVEVAALKEVFGDHAYRIPVNSTKSMLGHCLSSAGLVELVATILQMERGALHPTINQEEKDPELDLDFVPNQARPARIEVAISNGFGFGGLNSCLVVGRAS
jgi:3-oxoacyl-(acyl-carrier-protein) synthase